MNVRIPLLLLLLFLLGRVPTGAGETGRKPYGFRGFEIYKLERGIHGLTVFDANGDGLQDLLVINNAKAKIEVLLRSREPVPPKTRTGQKLPNDLIDDRFFERKEILTEKNVAAVVAADLNGDGHSDVAYYGKPEELVVAYGDGKGNFGKTTSYGLEDYTSSAGGLDAGDLNGDGRADLALLAKGYTSLYYQTSKGTLAEPIRVPHSLKGVTGVGIYDLDGDKRMDLLHFAPASPRSVRARFGSRDGSLGAEIAFQTSAWRVIDIVDIGPDPGSEVIVVQRTSGILRSLRMTSETAAGVVALGTAEVHAFEAARSGKARSMALGDVNGDGKRDIVVTEPGTAQVAIYFQGADGELEGRRTFPSLSDSSAVRVADLDGDGRDEVVVLSSAERAVGVTSLKEGRLPFPSMLPLDGGVPKAMDTGDLDGDGRPDLAVVTEKDKQRFVRFFWKQKLASGQALAGLKNAPDDLMILDIDQDGHADLLLFDRFGPMRVWLSNGKGGYEEYKTEGKSALIQKLVRGNVGVADIDGDRKGELLVTSKNFARAITLDRKTGFRIKDQANGRSPQSQIKGVVALQLDADRKAEVALFDRDKNKVSILRRGAGEVFEIAANLSVGELEYRALFAEDVNDDGKTDIIVFGKNRFGVLYQGGETHRLTGIFSIESSLRDAQLSDFAVGDLNGNGKPDLAVIDVGNRGLQIFSYDPKKGFGERLSFPIYQKKLHEQRRRSRGGASELVVTDFDGDGLNDIALIVHDRVIVYLQ